MAQWLIIVSWIAVILALLTALAIAFDVTAHPQHMKMDASKNLAKRSSF
jgi:hypothetical protein